jgi:glutamate/tyrosine decarboxylase-like PLP-dependent enzyme
MPKLQRPAREVFAEMYERKGLDAAWLDGKVFSLLYPTGRSDIDEVLVEANTAYLFENALNPLRFPSVSRMQREVVNMVSSLVNAPDASGAGFTAGGTESILMSVLVSRERAKAERGIERGNIVLPISAHPAFAKAAFYLGLEVRTTPLTMEFTADVGAVCDAVDTSTALMVGSAYGYPHGVIDPIEELSTFALSKSIPFHSDTCIGSFVLPFLERLGHEVPPFDFRLPGVTQMSCDIHKYGYSTKGASAIVYRDSAWLRHQVFDYDAWPSGRYRTGSVAGARAASPIAAAWAVMTYLGEAGYIELMGELMEITAAIRSGIEALEGLEILGTPRGPLLSFTSTTSDIFAIGDVMDQRGWHLNRVDGPPGLHMMISPLHGAHVVAFLDDLAGAVAAHVVSRDTGVSYS